MFLRITFNILLCCKVSREMFSGRSSESTTPLMKLRYSGISSSQLSMMNTRRTYSLMLFRFFLFSKRSNGARRGTNSNALNSNWPSTEKCYNAMYTKHFSRVCVACILKAQAITLLRLTNAHHQVVNISKNGSRPLNMNDQIFASLTQYGLVIHSEKANPLQNKQLYIPSQPNDLPSHLWETCRTLHILL